MKRDMDLVRDILLKVEGADDQLYLASFSEECERWSRPMVAYHVELLCSQGLIDGSVQRSGSGKPLEPTVSGLTWSGQDFLDAVRDRRVWDRAREGIAKTVGSATFDVVKAFCSAIALQSLKNWAGIS